MNSVVHSHRFVFMSVCCLFEERKDSDVIIFVSLRLWNKIVGFVLRACNMITKQVRFS